MNHSRASQLPPEVRLEYPFASNTLDLPNGAKLHYLDEGNGPVVLMLHGNPTWSFYYRNLIKKLSAAGFRCIVPDHIGCGLSDKPVDYNYTLRQRIEDVESLLDYLAIDRFSLVLHDWGGAIGCGVAGRRDNSVDRMVLLNTAAFHSKHIPLRIAAIKIPLIGEAIIRGMNGFAGPAATMAVKIPLRREVRLGMLWPYRSWKNRVAVWNFVKDIPLHAGHRSYQTLTEVEAGLKRLGDKPVQLIWGGRDFCFSRHFHDRFLEFFPQAESKVYTDCGHYVLEDAGADAFERIEGFLRS